MMNELSLPRFIAGLPPASRARLESVCRPRNLSRNEVLFHEGAEGDTLFFVLRGRVRLHKTAADGREVVIRTILPGEAFAEAILFERTRYPVTAVALTDAEVMGLNRMAVRRLLEEPAFRDDVLGFLLGRLRYLTDRLRDFQVGSVEDRFFAFVREQAGGGRSFVQSMPKREIAATIGVTPETLSRLIRRLTAEGRLLWRGRRVSLTEGHPGGDE